MHEPQPDPWLGRALSRLHAEGFQILQTPSVAASGFSSVAHRSRFEVTKFGNSETFFVFANAAEVSPAMLSNFSAAAFAFAMRSKSFPLPCGFFESVWCFAVAITSHVHPHMGEFVRSSEAPKHWAGAEMRVVYDRATGALWYFDRTPMWGAAYYAGFRSQIQRYLG